jgi:GntR family transcriptional regulator
VFRTRPVAAENAYARPRSTDQAEASSPARLRLLETSYDKASIPSTMLEVKVDRSEALGLHEQVAAELRRAIAEGEARPGERLPPARDLAAVLGVNRNTVLRALRLLREEGLLEFRRGRGITVAGTRERGAVVARTKELVEFARQQGYRREDLIKLIETVAE